MPIDTLYDVLNISRNAPPEIIRAAYKALSQKYHPDKFVNASATDKAFANNMMVQLNQAYQVLSDPIQRKAYDAWLDNRNLNSSDTSTSRNHSDTSHKNITISVNYGDIGSSIKSIFRKIKNIINNFFMGMLLIVKAIVIRILLPGLILVVIGVTIQQMYERKILPESIANFTQSVNETPTDITTVSNTYQSTDNQEYITVHPDTSKPTTLKTRLAPNGKPFPNRPKHLDGYPKLNTDGLSTITVDNSQNDSDIFGKLYYLDVDTPKAVRYFFIPAYGGLILRDVTKGNYDIRYKDLDTDQIAKSEPFEVQEIESYAGTQFSDITMTLYKVADGNMQTTTIPDSEF
ncbi:J domain-containing protein [Moraxella atlantae]|uniref:Chaperone protein DnaJ n=1 Tax=Faucicola atlantae TaxID=34059 RepID=A0A378Q3M1_9GAMM|nr:J domain-containing protein [Moraxella atlantae]OPH35121.1 hypothetical protein B5J92_05550 [Moraxella atlantae]STY95014.1 Chaperone protein DnaJ [Moraxella atlantae]